MLTRWGEALDQNNVLPEYPRPQMARERWMNLNGPWDYAIRKTPGLPIEMDGTILVPFSPEAPLSGVNRTLHPDEFLWYRRTLPRSPAPGMRTLLHFGAVDECATVFVNGAEVGSHEGGYLPFSFDITDRLHEDGNELAVRVTDGTDTSSASRGKQKTARGGIWYTPQSGIWQTVWMETVPEAYVASLVITPCFDEARAEITVESSADLPVTLTFPDVPDAVFSGRTNAPVSVPLPGFVPWSPENPRLYPFTVRMGDDAVTSYLAMRKISVGLDGAGVPRLLLNNEPYFQSGVLDQGYWPDGLYTAPADEAMVFDISLMKRMGFTMLRKHIKIEPLRWYHHCDRLGMLVWQDMVNGGGQYKPFTISAPLVLGNSHRDSDYRYFAREDAEGRAQYRRELADTVRHLYNVPSIVLWVPFNEGWGQFDAADATSRIKALDKTRLVDHASGWHDQGVGDVKSLHVYFKPYRFWPDRLGRAVVLSEFGGYGERIPGHCYSSRAFGYKNLATPEALLAAYEKLYTREILPAVQKGLAATVYTQLSDVEEETNGFVTYDRRVIKLPEDAVRKLNHALTNR